MGLIEGVMSVLFGGRRNVVRETAEVFRENAEASAARASDRRAQVLEQFAAEFERESRGWFDRFIDGVNRLPRPALALGTLALLAAAMTDPAWFAARMEGLALVPEPLWWLLGAVVSFYFGARHQMKGQDFQRSIAATLARAPQIADAAAVQTAPPPERRDDSGPETGAVAVSTSGAPNAALADWRRSR